MMDAVSAREPAEKSPTALQAEQLNDAAMAIIKTDEHNGAAAAISMLRRARALQPDMPEIWSNLGLLYWRIGRLDPAEAAFRHAVALDPNKFNYQGNLGIFLGAIGQAKEAVHHLEEAMRLDPDNLGPRWDRCLLYLRQGDWALGLPEYDVRREHRGTSLYPRLPAPLWQGEDLNGKTLYVQGEQGVGDRFLFSRYFAWIKETWPDCRIKACLHDSMVNLFWEFRHIVEMLPLGVPWPDDLDYCVYLCSLPAIHGSTPDNVPADPGLLRKRVLDARKSTKANLPQPNLPALKVGICWTGNPTQARNHDRTIPLEMLLPLAEDPRIMLYSFQCSPGGADLKRLIAGELICDLGSDIEREGWVSTGIALMEMDVLVSVCTSVPHLAGALQVPCWTMLCADPYWVWSRSGDTTPWYPGMRLFRQRRLGDWKPVIAEVRAELSKLADITLAK
jgi:hypothetical protein